ncbi:hypothetical protein [Ammoniphilus resinae]|uniref:PurR-regulated permease PerM n=1 Tax=Ammoniphilus resinae TaxID=861532 RepID=A0ABS4GIN5_9BACL|nr:hypothetical protein [Ammoniphilus resinae]MBP1930104.1 putative PurR-regulated permease PerM [Ammoniphilus resinae]
MGNNNNVQDVGSDLISIAVWVTVLADLMAAIGTTIITVPESNTANDDMQNQLNDIQEQLKKQKKEFQKQQIQIQLWQIQQELRELEQQLKQK